MSGPLAGVRVVDFGTGQAGSMASLLLAQAGALVTKLRDLNEGITLTATEDALWNRQKIKQAIDFSTSSGREQCDAILTAADILIHDKVPYEAKAAGLDADTLDQRFPRLIHVAIGSWPVGHPKENTAVRDILAMAECGILDEQPAMTRDGPVYLRFALGSNIAAYLAAIGALSRLYARKRTGRGGRADTSLVQAGLLPMMMLWMRAERPTRSVETGSPKTHPVTIFETGDGLWIHVMGKPSSAPTMHKALEAMDLEERARFNAKYKDVTAKYIADWQEWGAIEAIFKTQTRDYWLKELWASDIPVQPVLEIGELYDDEQAQANGYILAEDVDGHVIRRPGPPFQVDEKPSIAPGTDPSAQALRFPLEGLKVLDLGNFLAGPLGSMLLADLGADVIKLEAVSGDPMRPVEWAFNGCQRNKRDIAVQLKDAKGREILERLIKWADVLHHNQRLPAAERLGFGFEAANALNPALVYCHVSSYGSKGPRKDWPGYDQLFQAAAGWEHASAGEGNAPTWYRFGMVDHLGALASVVATLLALYRRDNTGSGEMVGASLLGACMATLDTYALSDGSFAPYPKLDKRQVGLSPVERLYQCKDGWLAVSARFPETGLDILRKTFGTSEIESLLADSLMIDIKKQLSGTSIEATEVRCGYKDAFFNDPANHTAHLVATFDHVIYGRFEQIGAFWNFGDLAVRLDRAPPLLGQHTTEILSEIGYDSTAQKTLAASGIIDSANQASSK